MERTLASCWDEALDLIVLPCDGTLVDTLPAFSYDLL